MKSLRICCLIATLTGLLVFFVDSTTAQSNTTACPLTWQVVPTPNVGSESNALSAVAAVSSNDVWAAGYYRANNSDHALMLHWDGAQWSQVTAPDVGEIADLQVIAPNDIWTGGTNPLHWNGTTWQVVTAPAAIAKMSALASDNIWALGQDTSVLNWDGTTWALVPSPDVSGLPNPNLTDIYAVSDNDVWIVGWFSPGSVGWYPIIEHWNGVLWEWIAADSSDHVELLAIDGSINGALWLAGSVYFSALSEQWDGMTWGRSITLPIYGDGSGGDTFNGIDVRDADDVWAVGSATRYQPYYQPPNPLIQHWDGTTWRVETVPFSIVEGEYLRAVSAFSNTEVWVVGGAQVDGIHHTLALHGALPCSEIAPIPDEPKRVTRNNTIFTSLPVELRWKRSDGAKFYHVRVEGARQPYDILLDRRVTRPRKLLNKLLPSANKYYWFVSACNDYGCSPWRGRRFFYQSHNH